MAVRALDEVATGVFVATSEKYDTSSTVIVSGDRAVLVDPAWTLSELDGLCDWLGLRRVEVTAGFSTHAHHDHLLWHPGFGDVPRWASPTSVACVAEWGNELRQHLTGYYPTDWPDPLAGITALQSSAIPDPFGRGDDELFELFDLIVHNGHAPGHTAVWMPERGVLLAGDMLSDVELPLPFDPDDLTGYLEALDALAPAVAQARVLVPGHGHATQRPLDRLDADRRYLDAVISGEDPDDQRRGLPGMAAAHDRIVALARSGGDGAHRRADGDGATDRAET